MQGLAARIQLACDGIRSHWNHTPRAGIILGSGLGDFASQVAADVIIPYEEIPGFPQKAATIGHRGELVCGTISGVPVATMAGRFHFYEGHAIDDVAFPVRVMKALGVEYLIVSNASGGLNPAFGSSDIMVMEDHIQLMFQNPLIGVNDDTLGPRFPDMSAPYDRELIEMAQQIARQNDFQLHQGVYAALTGPTYETRAEYRMLRYLGADVVGMSTVPEVIVARHAGLRVLALSVVTNVCQPDSLQETTGEDVVDAAGLAEPQLTAIVRGVLERVA